MIYAAASSLTHFYRQYGQISALVKDCRWFSLYGMYYCCDTPFLNRMKAMYG